MNCGLGNLKDLKRALLLEDDRATDTYDAAVMVIWFSPENVDRYGAGLFCLV